VSAVKAVEKLREALTAADADTARDRDDESIKQLNDAKAAFRLATERSDNDEGLLSGFIRSLMVINPGQLSLILVAVILLGALYLIYAVFSNDGRFLDKLAQIDYARGLITFLLSLGTILIAMLVVFSALTSDGSDASQKKVSMAKEVLTVLVGIFGTILGFYFGSEKSRGPLPPKLDLSPVIVASSGGGVSTIAATVSGGTPPYTYSIEFKGDAIHSIKDQKTGTSRISQVITNETQKSVPFTLTVVDRSTNQLSHASTEEEQIPGKANQ